MSTKLAWGQTLEVSLQTDYLIGTSAQVPQHPMVTYTGKGNSKLWPSWAVAPLSLSLFIKMAPEAPRKAAASRFRPLTEHDFNKSHLYQIGITNSPDWGQPMTTENFSVCPALKSFNCIVKKYWRARALMT
ncbi:hypothetical protein TNCV_1104841 [Trichonephila clavipes]|nr:hypothetical protein TNCV_1104841 [Trichonephila clavipes]